MKIIDGFIGRWRRSLSAGVAAQAGRRCGSVRQGGAQAGLRLGICGLALGLGLAAGGVLAQPRAAPEQRMSPAELTLLEAVNSYRRSQGREPWVPEQGLAQVARGHSVEMAALGQLSHEGFQRRAAGTGSDLCVENLLRGSVPPARAVQLWTQSPAHRDNLLEAAARHAGIGIAGPFVTLLACATPPSSRDNAASAPGRR